MALAQQSASLECDFTRGTTCPRCGRVVKAPVRAICRPQPPKPGTELKALLKTVGITAEPNCSCNKRARLMDERGCDWCEQNIEEISGWLAEEAKKRKLPYVAAAGKLLIRMAIKRARRTLASKEEPR